MSSDVLYSFYTKRAEISTGTFGGRIWNTEDSQGFGKGAILCVQRDQSEQEQERLPSLARTNPGNGSKKDSKASFQIGRGYRTGKVCPGKLSQFWSPECIAAIWNRLHPLEPVSFSTIYLWLKKGLLVGFSRKTHLRRRGKKFQTRKANYNTIHPDRLIEEWPEDIVNRTRIGDWEGDTIYGAIGKGFVLTMVDRKSRLLCASLVSSRSPVETKAAIQRALHDVPVRSISLDNGSEFALFRDLENEINAPVFFARPHSPWQRGSNENLNGLLRFFFPKGSDFLSVTDEQLQFVVYLINSRPRKCLDWRSPIEVFLSSSVALP